MDLIAILWEKLAFRATQHLVTSERQPRSTLSLQSNSFEYFEYYEECNSITLNNLAQWSPLKDPDPLAAFVPPATLSPPQRPSHDLKKTSVFLTGPPLQPQPHWTSRNPWLEPAPHPSSSPGYLSESAQRSLHWNCRAKIVATPTPSVTSNVPAETTQVQQPTVFDSSHSPVQTYSSPSYCPQYESCALPVSVPEVPSVPSDSGYGYNVSPYQSAEFEAVGYEQHLGEQEKVDQWIDYLRFDDEELSFELDESIFNNIDTSLEDMRPAESQEFQAYQSTVTYQSTSPPTVIYQSSSPSTGYSTSHSPSTSQFVPIAPKPASYQQSQPITTAMVESAPVPEPAPASRKRRVFQFSSPEEEYYVKRQLNNEASAKSRAKKRAKIEATKAECTELEARNRELKDTLAELERQVDTLKDILYSKIKH